MFGFKKKVSVMNGKPFIAAYSDKRFKESKSRVAHPDHTFHDSDGAHWCVRVGDVKVPWGVGDQGKGYSANGTLTVSRLNVDEASFTGRGLPFVKEGDVFYLYEMIEGQDDEMIGFVPYIRDEVLKFFTGIASNTDADGFAEAVNGLKSDPDFTKLLMDHRLVLKGVTITKINIIKKGE